MNKLPKGTVTFLFSDVEGSTRLWEQHSDGMKAALACHDLLLRRAVESNQGTV
ncbi:MAG: cyclase, partial [Chloroflexi bacterium]|nr:cyclase [Chloroflexota bacterium]